MKYLGNAISLSILECQKTKTREVTGNQEEWVTVAATGGQETTVAATEDQEAIVEITVAKVAEVAITVAAAVAEEGRAAVAVHHEDEQVEIILTEVDKIFKKNSNVTT